MKVEGEAMDKATDAKKDSEDDVLVAWYNYINRTRFVRGAKENASML